MNNDQFQREKMYQATMSIARNLFNMGIVSDDEYAQIDTIFTNKYKPTLGSLLADIGLITLECRGNM